MAKTPALTNIWARLENLRGDRGAMYALDSEWDLTAGGLIPILNICSRSGRVFESSFPVILLDANTTAVQHLMQT